MKAAPLEIPVTFEALDEQLRALRLLASQIGFALDNYLVARPSFGPVRALVDEQAEDEGLWFIAQTAPEAYLQQELRRLHTAIANFAENSHPVPQDRGH